MEKKKKEKKKKEKKESAVGGGFELIKDAVLDLVSNFFKGLADQIKNEAQRKVDLFVFNAKKASVLIFLFLIGFIFILVGMAKIIEELVDFDGIGFLFLGFLLLTIAYFFNFFSQEQ